MTSKLEKENQELKELYAFERQLNRNQYGIIKEFYEKNLKLEDELNKFKKIIEILSVNNIHKRTLKLSKNVDDYNSQIEKYSYFDELTQEEYELLKEYLDD